MDASDTRRLAQHWSTAMTLSLFHVDAFTDRPFAGNPAAVCLLSSWRQDQWLQAVARDWDRGLAGRRSTPMQRFLILCLAGWLVAGVAGAEPPELKPVPLTKEQQEKLQGGPLAYVPFEALVEDDRYLIETHRIRYAPSLNALYLVRLWKKTRPQPQRTLWVMADPVYDQADPRVAGEKDPAQATQDALAKYLRRADRGPARGEAYARLCFNGQEAEAIRARLGAADTDVVTGLQASEAAVKAASAKGLLPQARYVHFAAHGILGLDTGQPPALVLNLLGNDGARDADGGINDGFLRLDEVTFFQLNADLVVLSACETGRGRL
jgi:CHAT domain-containing protein